MIRPLIPGRYTCDICIIGAGPAGLTLAAELAYSGKKVCVLESGGQKRTVFAQSLKEALSEELPIKPDSRERVVGGSSSTWGGLSALLDDIDFSFRQWHDGWPIKATDLSPYLTAAQRYKFPSPEMFEPSLYPSGWGQFENLEEKVFVAVRPPYHFGSLQLIFERVENDLYTEATVTELVSKKGKIIHAICKTPDGGAAYVESKIFVVAAGGIENSRLLLNSQLGNEHDQVGRYFMNHPKGYAGSLYLRHSLPADSPYLPRVIHGRMVYTGFRLTESFQKEHNLLNSCIQLEPHLGIFQRYAFGLWRRLPDFSLQILVFLRPRLLRPRWFTNMEPRSENRVILGEKRDVFGSPLPIVRYALGEQDKTTLVALHTQLKKNIERLKLGKLYGDAKEVVEAVTQDASHHLGGTRMGLNPHTSVVDSNCKVHSISNLYIAGGSVFPTGGCANPTLTIVALSIRLAEHLKRVFKVIEDGEPKNIDQGRNNIIIIGAGKRISLDVLPALESLHDSFVIKGLYSRHFTAMFGSDRQYDVLPLNKLSEGELRGVRFICSAVPPRSVTQVLKDLPSIDKDTELIIDTPVVLPRSVRQMLGRFKRVHIAEDSIFLPWISVVKQLPQIRKIDCVQSVYRYHGVALLKTMTSHSIRYGWRWGNRLWLRAGMTRVRIIEPRDYSVGKLFINGEEVEILRDGNKCTGFRLGDVHEKISKTESQLVGFIEEGDTIISRMGELKRVGLRRFLMAVSRGDKTWELSDGLNDVRVDSFIHRLRLYLSFRQ